jgi:hypothetical protein
MWEESYASTLSYYILRLGHFTLVKNGKYPVEYGAGCAIEAVWMFRRAVKDASPLPEGRVANLSYGVERCGRRDASDRGATREVFWVQWKYINL